jgi:hypothetical protein
MQSYRNGIYGVVIFAFAYPLVAGTVLIKDWDSGFGEIYPIAPWALFCFVPNRESDFGIRVTAVDGHAYECSQYFEQLPQFSEKQKTIGTGIIREMGALSNGTESPEFEERRRLFECNFLHCLGRDVHYELVCREYEVLDRWRKGEFQRVELIGAFVYHEEPTDQ